MSRATASAAPGAIPVTVAVLNHRRPHLLARVLAGVLQLDYPAFEIVVVGDRVRLSDYALPDRMARAVRYFPCDEANICRARNVAVRHAAGEVVAFCDDDAVPEPDWLDRLAAPFAEPRLGAAGGVVWDAAGTALEWDGGRFDRAGTEFPLAGRDSGRVVTAAAQAAAGRYLALRGVNSAFRRSAVLEAGGFDEAYRYYLDETDMALRLADAGWSAALVRDAEVHHFPQENVSRGALRQPRDLFEVAASKVHFCRRHLPAERVAPEIAAFREARLRALDTHMRLGLLRRGDRARLARRFDEGVEAGLARAAVLPLAGAAGGASRGAFAAFRPPSGRLRVALVTGWGPARIARLRGLARQIAAEGHAVSCFSYMSGTHAPEITFDDGFWLHRGGTWRLNFSPHGLRSIGRGARARAEIRRLAARRQFDVVLRPARPGDAGPLLALAGMRASLAVEPARDDGPDLSAVSAELRRIIGTRRPAPAAEAGVRAGPALSALAPGGPTP